jgi:filamentous hemagglutinin
LAVTNSSKDIFTWTSAGDIALRTGGRAVISSGISTAIQGGSFGDNFNAALLGEAGNVAMATGFNWVGDYVTFPNGSPQKIIAHALMGGLLAEATGSDFKTGAAAAGLNEALINQLAWAAQDNKDLMLMLSQLTGLVAAAAVDGDLEKGAQVAQKATTFNYLTHQKFDEVRDCISGRTCSTDAEKIAAKTEAERLSKLLDDEMNDICSKNPGSDSCRTAVNSAIKYMAIKDAWNVMHGDVERSSKNTFDYLYNTEEGKGSFVSYFNTIDNRANFFSGSDTYEHQLGIGAKWFGGADTVSRAPFTGLGADGNASYITFGAGWVLAPVYDWRKAAGDSLMAGGYENFKALYNGKATDPVVWDINQLKNEQKTLQPIHEEYLQDHKRFVGLTKDATSNEGFMKYIPFVETQRIEGGVDILEYKSRVTFGCKLLGYSAGQGCAP